MNRTRIVSAQTSHKIQRTADGQQLALGPVEIVSHASPKWELSDRLAWALGLKVSPHAKLIAVAIASHTGASSGLAWPGMGPTHRRNGTVPFFCDSRDC